MPVVVLQGFLYHPVRPHRHRLLVVDEEDASYTLEETTADCREPHDQVVANNIEDLCVNDATNREGNVPPRQGSSLDEKAAQELAVADARMQQAAQEMKLAKQLQRRALSRASLADKLVIVANKQMKFADKMCEDIAEQAIHVAKLAKRIAAQKTKDIDERTQTAGKAVATTKGLPATEPIGLHIVDGTKSKTPSFEVHCGLSLIM